MDGSTSPTALLAFLGPKIPMMLKTALFHSLSLSHTSSKWDLRSELVVKVIRAEISSPRPMSITQQQQHVNKIHPVKGPTWVSRVAMPAPPEDDIRAALLQAIEDMKQDGDEAYTVPELRQVEAEWQGHRAGVPKDAPEPSNLSEEEKYAHMLKEVHSDAVVLYFHGGAFYLLDPSSHRATTTKYAQQLGGARVFSVRYRLAPQNPFPAALLDALLAYLSLLHPPPGSLHAPVPADKIIVAGDSAGGNLALVLTQTLLQLRRAAGDKVPTMKFHGKDVPVPLPGALALTSPWTDITRALPSIAANAHYDYLPPPTTSSSGARFPPCEAWPTNPPRVDLYCEGSALTHPLVSPLSAPDWADCPPVLFIVGEEMMADESKVLAHRMVRQGVSVVWGQYEAMPHCFALMLEGNSSAGRAFEQWAAFARSVVGGQ
ncbi:uncharacterized protein K452DRAFT_208645, partial [Aplosporella prunicola CBS 121167]